MTRIPETWEPADSNESLIDHLEGSLQDAQETNGRLRAINAELLEALEPFTLFFSAFERLTDLDRDNHLEAVLKIGHQTLTVGAFVAAVEAVARARGES